jgi:hypothetical protein
LVKDPDIASAGQSSRETKRHGHSVIERIMPELHIHYLGRGRPIRGRCDILYFSLTSGSRFKNQLPNIK